MQGAPGGSYNDFGEYEEAALVTRRVWYTVGSELDAAERDVLPEGERLTGDVQVIVRYDRRLLAQVRTGGTLEDVSLQLDGIDYRVMGVREDPRFRKEYLILTATRKAEVDRIKQGVPR